MSIHTLMPSTCVHVHVNCIYICTWTVCLVLYYGPDICYCLTERLYVFVKVNFL